MSFFSYICTHTYTIYRTGLIEILTIPALLSLGKNDRAAGDYSFDPLRLGSKPKDLEKYKINELKNGRLAMLAFSGIITQAALTGKAFPCKLLMNDLKC